MLNWRTLLFGLGFGLLDSIALPIIKTVSLGANPFWMIIPTLVYAMSPFAFLAALKWESLTIMNLVWDLTSDIVVTLIGIFLFRESIPPVKMLGVAFSFVALFLMTYEGNGWNEFLETHAKRVVEVFKGYTSA